MTADRSCGAGEPLCQFRRVTPGVRPMQLQPVTLHGRHVRLVPMSLDHVPALWEAGSDPELWRWTQSVLRSADDVQRYVETALAWQAAGTALPFVTTLAEDGRIVGSTRFANYEADNRKVEIGWTWIAAAWQRTSVNTEAKYLMLRHAFESLGCVRVELKTDALNAKSRAAIARLGAREEGILRSHLLTETGRRRDTAYYSIL